MSIPRHLNPLSSWKFADAQECYKGILSLPNVGRDMDSQEVLMRKVVASELVSLDGVVESPQKWHFPYFNDQMGEAIGAAMAASDAMLMGRVLYSSRGAISRRCSCSTRRPSAQVFSISTTSRRKAEANRGPLTSHPGPYSPRCVEGVLSEIRGGLRKVQSCFWLKAITRFS
jgi:hypothetical protein